MAIRPILTAPDPRLKAVSEPVSAVDNALRALMDDMLETMYASEGIGLAAVQVGVPKRVIVMDLAPKDAPRMPLYFVNPVVTWASAERVTTQEGCLSVPDVWDDVERPARIKAEYLDYHGKKQTLEAEGVLAICLQHEIDHTNGVLFIDRISKLRRDMAVRKVTKAKRLSRAM